MRLHVRGRSLPDGEPVEWWIVDEGSPEERGSRGVLSAEPVAGAETVFDGGWILPGQVDAPGAAGAQSSIQTVSGDVVFASLR